VVESPLVASILYWLSGVLHDGAVLDAAFPGADHGSRVWHDGGFISSSVGDRRMAFDPLCSFTLLSADALAQAFYEMNKAEPAHRPIPYKLALGLLKHPDRQLSGAGHAGRSQRI
jgi:hypothetical protein